MVVYLAQKVKSLYGQLVILRELCYNIGMSSIVPVLRWIGMGVAGVASVGVIGGTIATTNSEQSARSVNEAMSNFEQKEAKPEIVVKTETEVVLVPFETRYEDDNTLAKGTVITSIEGMDGERTDTYSVTYTDGAVTERVLVSSEVTKEPVTRVIKNGTYEAPQVQQPSQTQATPQQQAAPAQGCPNGAYVNSAGNIVCRPSAEQGNGATAICRDGTYSYSQTRSGACSGHRGVSRWL